LTVTPATLTYNATAANSIYGNTPSVNAGTVTGFVNGQTLASATTGTLAFSTTASSGSNVGSYAINGSGLTANNGNYTFVQAAGNTTALTISPATIAITGANNNVTYNGSAQTNTGATASINGGAATGISGTTVNTGIGGQSFTLSGYGSGTNASGTAYADNLVLAAVFGTIAGNYAITYINGGLTIGKATLTVTANNQSAVYGSGVVLGSGSTQFTVSGLQNNQTIGSVTLASTGASNTANVGSYNIVPSGATGGSFNINNYAITYTNGTLSVTPATLSVTGSLVYNGTATINASSLTATGVNGQTFSISGAADLSSKNVQTNQPLADVTGLVLTPNGSALSSNYAPLNVTNTSVSVTPLSITLVAPTINKVYDGSYNYTMTSANLAALSNQLVGGDAVTAASVAFAGNNANVGSNKVVSLLSATISDGNNGANYNVALTSSSNSQITPAPLTITAATSAKFVTQVDPTGYAGAIYNGFVNGETASVLSGSLTIARSSPANNAAGSYVLTPAGYGASGSVNGNYQITYQTGTFTIVPAQYLLITVNPVTSTYGATPTYTLTARYLASNNSTITYLGTNGSAPSATPVTLTTNGNAPITVGDGVGSTATFTITPTGAATSGSGNIVVGGYNLVASNTSTTGSNFLGFSLAGSLTVNPMTLSASQLGISGVSRVYNGSNAITGLTLNTSPLLSSVLSGDSVNVLGTGTFNNANVGTNKAITLNVSLTGADAANYVLSNVQLTGNTGTITQLASVTYVGASGGNWSNAGNWAGGAIPTLSNVANVIIPANTTVVYDNAALVNQLPTSTITNNGIISFTGSNNFTFGNTVSGSGSISQSGAGVLTITGNNSYSGGTNINGSSLIVGSSNALGTGAVSSNGGSLLVASGIVLPSLTVNGSVTLGSDLNTTGNQTYNGAVTLGAGNAVGGVITPMQLSSANGNIAFNSTLIASQGSYGNEQSLTVSATNGQVTFGDTVGASVINGNGQYLLYTSAYFNNPNIYNLDVTANAILLKGNITTFGTQTYTGAVRIGDNGSNGPTRILLSEDPAIIFNGTVDDTSNGTHNLVVEAIAINSAQMPAITFTQAVGSIAPLASLYVKTGDQNTDPSVNPVITDIAISPANYAGNIAINANISTTGNQTYTANTIGLGNAQSSNQVTNDQIFTTNGGVIAFNLGAPANGGGIAPYNGPNYTLGFALNGGSVTGLSGSGLSYQTIGLVTPATTLAGPTYRANSDIDAGILEKEVGRTMLVSYSANDSQVAGGSVSVGQPEGVAIESAPTPSVATPGSLGGATGGASNVAPAVNCMGNREGTVACGKDR
jgi:hypothetical protein